MLEMIVAGKLEPKRLIGREISLEEAVPALTTMDRATDLGINVITRF
jgi:alcohol dehydrogenase